LAVHIEHNKLDVAEGFKNPSFPTCTAISKIQALQNWEGGENGKVKNVPTFSERRKGHMVAVELLRRFDFFLGFSDEQMKKLADIAAEESYKAGFQLWRKGDQARNLYLLEGGKIVLVMEAYMGTARPAMELTVDIVTKGDAMGWSAIIEPYVYTLGARCIDDSKAISLDGAKLRELLNKDTSLGYEFMQATVKVIATRLTHTQIILIGERGLSVIGEE
jgi:CRP-like cAMP-binding protein